MKFTKAIARHTKIRDQNPSLGYICPGEPHERSPNAPKFEDRSQEETEWQERDVPCQSVSRRRLLCSMDQGNLWEKEMSINQCSSAHSKFSGNTQAEKVVDRTGKPVGENSSNAQIRTLLDEQRQMIIADYCEKIGHHELQAAHAEEERRILREELWRQQMDFREVHQQNLTEMEELRKFQSSTFDTLARRKLIKDQNTILELSGRVQDLQNEVKLYERF